MWTLGNSDTVLMDVWSPRQHIALTYKASRRMWGTGGGKVWQRVKKGWMPGHLLLPTTCCTLNTALFFFFLFWPPATEKKIIFMSLIFPQHDFKIFFQKYNFFAASFWYVADHTIIDRRTVNSKMNHLGFQKFTWSQFFFWRLHLA